MILPIRQIHDLLEIDKTISWVPIRSKLLNKEVKIPSVIVEDPVVEDKVKGSKFAFPSSIFEKTSIVENFFREHPLFYIGGRRNKQLYKLLNSMQNIGIVKAYSKEYFENFQEKNNYSQEGYQTIPFPKRAHKVFLVSALQFKIKVSTNKEEKTNRQTALKTNPHVFTFSEDWWPLHLIKFDPNPLESAVQGFKELNWDEDLKLPYCSQSDCFSRATTLVALASVYNYAKTYLTEDSKHFLENEFHNIIHGSYDILDRFKYEDGAYSRFHNTSHKSIKETAWALLAKKAMTKGHVEFSDLQKIAKETLDWMKKQITKEGDGAFMCTEYDKGYYHREDKKEVEARKNIYENNKDYEEETTKISTTSMGVIAFIAYKQYEEIPSLCDWLKEHIKKRPKLEKKALYENDMPRILTLLAFRFALQTLSEDKQKEIAKLVIEISEGLAKKIKDGYMKIRTYHPGGATEESCTFLTIYTLLECGFNYNAELRNAFICLFRDQNNGFWQKEFPHTNAYAMLAITKYFRPDISPIITENLWPLGDEFYLKIKEKNEEKSSLGNEFYLN